MQSFLFGIVLMATPAADTVTLDMMAKPVGEVVAEVARQTQLPIRADASASSRPVFISVDKMPVKVFLERLAKITDCEWHTQGERSILTRGNRARAAIIAEQNERAALFGPAMKLVAAQLEQTYSLTAQAQEREFQAVLAEKARREELEPIEFRHHPSGNAFQTVVIEFFREVSPATLARVEEGEPVVFSTSPNVLQEQLPYRPKAIDAALAAERKLLARLAAAGVRFSGLGSVATVVIPSRLPVAKLIVRVDASSHHISITCYLLGAQGQVVAQMSGSVNLIRRNPTPPPLPGRPAATLSSESLELMKAAREARVNRGAPGTSWAGGMFDRAASQTLRDKMRQPTLHEPNGWVVSDLLAAFRTTTGVPLMASVPDDLLPRLIYQSPTQGTMPIASLWSPGSLVSKKDSHGWIIHPRSWAEADRAATDRVALETLLTKQPTFDGLVRYASRASKGNTVGSLLLELLDQPLAVELRQRYALLQLLARVPGSLASADRTWPISGLSAEARKRALRLILTENLSSRFPPRSDNQPRYSADPTEGFRFDVDWQLGVTRNKTTSLCLVQDGHPSTILSPYEYGYRTALPTGHANRIGNAGLLTRINLDQMLVRLGATEHFLSQPLRIMSLTQPMSTFSADTLTGTEFQQLEAGRKAAGQVQVSGYGGQNRVIPPIP